MAKARPIGHSDRPLGGRPRTTPHRATAFSQWLEGGKLTVDQVAEELKISRTAVYHLRNSRFSPSLELANAIANLSRGAVPTDSWPARSRAVGRRSARRHTAGDARNGRVPSKPKLTKTMTAAQAASSDALTLAYYLLGFVTGPTSRRGAPIPEREHPATASRWARDIDKLIETGATAAKIQLGITFACSRAGLWRRRINSGAALRRWWPKLRLEIG